MNPRGDSGAAAAWMLMIMAMAVTLFAALLIDVGAAVNERSNVVDAAWALSRAAASEVTLSGGKQHIDEGSARERVVVLAATQWPDVAWTLDVGPSEATVTTSKNYEAPLMSAFGWGGVEISATHTAEVER